MNIAETMQNLYAQYGELEGITIECQNELIAIGIENQSATAEIFLQGAQISRYQQDKEKPVLWLSNKNQYKAGLPLRGGIPICWPWFGNINKNPEAITAQFTQEKLTQLNAHGFVREKDWQVTNIETPSTDLTIIELSYQIYAEQEPLWPFATKLLYRIEIGKQLKATLTVHNQDSMPFTYSTALHSYFSVKHINQVQIEGFDQSAYIDTLDDWSNNLQKGNILIDEEVDRIYQTGPDIVLKDSERDISIKNNNSKSTVIWNPWIEKSKNLSQFSRNDFETMICIETANIMDDMVYLEPEEFHLLELII